MHRLFVLLLLLLPSINVVAQTSSTPTSVRPVPATLRSLLLSELHSTHDKAEWFTPMNNAVAGLTADQAKWVPKNAEGKLDPNANHSVGMLANHLLFFGTRTRCYVCAAKSPQTRITMMRPLMTSTQRIGMTSCSGLIAS
jgi:hypothetical protein